MPFDTLKLAERLEAGGFTSAQARAATEGLAEALTGAQLATVADLKAEIGSLRSDMVAGDAAVRAELGSLRSDMVAGDSALRTEMQAGFAATGAEFTGLRAEMRAESTGLRAEMRAEFAAVRGEMREMEQRMTIKLGGMMIVGVGVLLTAMRFMHG